MSVVCYSKLQRGSPFMVSSSAARSCEESVQPAEQTAHQTVQ